MDVSVRGSLMWEEAGVPGESPRVQAGDRYILSHTTTVDHKNRARVAALICPYDLEYSHIRKYAIF